MDYISNINIEQPAIALGIFLLFLLFRKIFTTVIVKIAEKFVQNTKTDLDDKILEVIIEPIKFMFILIGTYLALKYINFTNSLIDDIYKSIIIITIFVVIYKIVLALEGTLEIFAQKFGAELHKEIAQFLRKMIKFFIVLIGGVSVLQIWDINVSAFLTSLGLGGLAFALAAKDTAANLFGGLTILADKSLRLGDWIKVGSVEGICEEIGLRTTKVRTFEKSLITLPNQILANKPVENFSRRGIRRIKFRVGLTYNTTSDTIVKIVSDIKSMLQSHDDIAQNSTMLVRFDKFEDSSLSIFIYTFTSTSNWDRYLEIKEDVNIKTMKIVENNSAEFAFPSQSIYIEKGLKEL